MICEKCKMPAREGCKGGLRNGDLCPSYIIMLRDVVAPYVVASSSPP